MINDQRPITNFINSCSLLTSFHTQDFLWTLFRSQPYNPAPLRQQYLLLTGQSGFTRFISILQFCFAHRETPCRASDFLTDCDCSLCGAH